MKNSIIQLQDIDHNKKFLGSKTLNLKRCVDLRLNVPKFVAISSTVTKELLHKEAQRAEIAKETASILRCKKYAVRSSALIEDGKNESYAGQFLTKINVSEKDLSDSILEVVQHADCFLKGDLDKFSLILQEYVDANIAGVTFTRNPNGDREMMMEYGYCEGEKIVGGQNIPEKLSFYWDEIPKNSPQFLTNETIETFKQLETAYFSPQDIEWCIKDGRFYILQTRPITTISKRQYEQIIALEKYLSGEKQYYYEKTEISEVAPRPVPLTFDLLERIYGHNGSVANAYKKFKVRYASTKFLHIIGNELFIDKEKEILGLLPAYSYLKDGDFKAHLVRYSKLLPTIVNAFYLNCIKTNAYEVLFQRLKHAIEAPVQQNSDVSENLNRFLQEYELIFGTNLLSGLSTKKIQAILKTEPVNFTEILNESSVFVDLNKYSVDLPKFLIGNSLDLNDETKFVGFEKIIDVKDKKVSQWWQGLSVYKRKYLGEKITESIVYSRLRELGRILMLKNISILRNSVIDLAKMKGFKELKNIFFTTFEEIFSVKFEEKLCEERRTLYLENNSFSFPSTITSSYIPNNSTITGVSTGEAVGILQNKDFIDSKSDSKTKYVLYTEILSPDLTKYFDKINGIVSENGGLLSHLAIIARERNIPVVTGVSLSRNKIKLGDIINIDGAKGTIVVNGKFIA